VLALSPYAQPFVVHRTLAGIDAPVMYQGGTLDMGITPFIIRSGGAYDQTPAPKYFVEFNGAGHLAWTDMRATYHDAMVEYARAFFDRYLKGKPFPQSLRTPHGDVTTVQIEP
jgi:pimeloyl-ACP methyl ester carboxylesterase